MSPQASAETTRGSSYARDRIAGIMTSKRWSQLSLAETTGIEPSHLSRILSGARELTLDHVCRIAYALGVKPGDLLENSAGAYADLLPILNQLRAFSADERYYVKEVLESAIRLRSSILQKAEDLYRPSPTQPQQREQGRKSPRPDGVAGSQTGEE